MNVAISQSCEQRSEFLHWLILLASPSQEKKIHSADLVNWRHLPSGDKFHSILGDVLPV